MRSRSPSIVPPGDDHEVYLVLDDFGGSIGQAWRETGVDDANLENLLTDLLDGQFTNPVRVIGFNAAEGWSRDVTMDIADQLRRRFAEYDEVPASLQEFVDTASRAR